ncbi:MAG: ribonuclease HI [Clostridia bacterium]|nr:ribonuclease HI [Clostridia bacterium]
MKKVIIYTDGACSGNPGPGGWAAILRFGEHEKVISGYEEETTNNKMELLAAIEAFRRLKESCEVELYSDSAYLINGFVQRWVEGWKAKGWINSSKEPVKNIDLWKELDSFNKTHRVHWIKVKGHSDNEYNNRCDKLAVEEIKKRKK